MARLGKAGERRVAHGRPEAVGHGMAVEDEDAHRQNLAIVVSTRDRNAARSASLARFMS